MKPFRLIAVALLLAAPLAGCASVRDLVLRLGDEPRAEAPDVRQALRGGAELAAETPVDRLYARAKAAILTRDYGLALDLLQLARARAPQDVRVLNALGVVYDKLGRFDLSRRYYELALAREPDSRVVAANLAYSAALQGRRERLAAAARPQSQEGL
ncbi:MAG: tetratricopeptide repeat protein [Phenylobacterium sp.]|uniref:tetratricopeptide repeat protein n=1 Tax=Phenylobacterium sp. TaxID=1871053 RepID=UPI003918BE8F